MQPPDGAPEVVRSELSLLTRRFLGEHGVPVALSLLLCVLVEQSVCLSAPVAALTPTFYAAFAALSLGALGWSLARAPKPLNGASWWRWGLPRRLGFALGAVLGVWLLSLVRVDPGLASRYLLVNAMTLLPVVCVLLVSWPEWTRADDANQWKLAIYLFLANSLVNFWVVAYCSLSLNDARPSARTELFSDLTAIITVALVYAEAGVAYLLSHDLTAASWKGSLSISDVESLERRWIAQRRESLGLRAPGEPNTPSWQPVGLCLSGGGIRSASVCLGFLRGLDRAGILPSVDYLSTVSGGGWAGSALLLSLLRGAGDAPGPDALVSPDGWSEMLKRFRLRGDYLAPGGLGLTTNTLMLLLSWLWGAVTNLFAPLLLIFSLLAWMKHLDAANGWVEHSLGALSSRPVFHWLFLTDPANRLTDVLKMLNLVAVLFVASCAALASGLGLMLFGYFFHARATYGFTVRFSAVCLRVAILSGALLALLHGRREVTLLLLVAFVAALAPRLSAGLTVGQKALVLGALIVGQHFFVDVRGPLRWVTEATALWHDALVAALLGPLRLAELVGRGWSDPYQFSAGIGLLGFALVLFAADPNRTSLHAMWREQLRAAFLDGTDLPLHHLHPSVQATVAPGALRGAPLPLFNCALNTPGSADGVLNKRGTARLEMSPLFVGGPCTGWAPSGLYAPSLSWASAIAVSAAAVNSQAGRFVGSAARMVMSIMNLRLGVWVRNPRGAGHPVRFRNLPRFWAAYALRELFGVNSETDPLIFVSDGGHHDNLGLSALVDRGCRLIVSVDAAADPAWNCPDIANAVRVLRVDGGWTLEGFDVDDVRPPVPGGAWHERLPKSPVVVTRLRRGDERIVLVYVKAGLTDELPADVRQYAEANPVFPQQSTSEQFFDEIRFEAYRMVGEALAARAATAIRDDADCRAVLDAQRTTTEGVSVERIEVP